MWSETLFGELCKFDTAAAGAMTLISTSTVSSSVSQVDITSGIDSTYDTYVFKCFDWLDLKNF